uniref:Uncharacterized protein n=1 Tax=viral metagenome TaxID=1070528 RepID=A0A6M3ILF4_9ZZZZ
MHIGNKKVKGVEKLDDGVLNVKFKDGSSEKINDNLYKLIKSEEKREGEVIDVIRHVLSTKFLSDMSEYGLDFYMVQHISRGMETLSHNMREELFSKTFDCNGANGIKLNKLISLYDEEVSDS